MRLVSYLLLLSMSMCCFAHASYFDDDAVITGPSNGGHFYTPTRSAQLLKILKTRIRDAFPEGTLHHVREDLVEGVLSSLEQLAFLPDQALAQYNAGQLSAIRDVPERLVNYVRDSYDDQSHPAWILFYKSELKEEKRQEEERREVIRKENSSCCCSVM